MFFSGFDCMLEGVRSPETGVVSAMLVLGSVP